MVEWRDATTEILMDEVCFVLCVCSELKSQYAQPPSTGTNINELPQLLQAIHTLRPTVFKSGSQQWQRKWALASLDV